jgi:secreted PhoX family phosphatase
LTYTKTQAIDFSKFGGLWTPCAGSISPWGSHVGSEEYEPDARHFFEAPTAKMNVTSIDGNKYEVQNFLDTMNLNLIFVALGGEGEERRHARSSKTIRRWPHVV